MSNLILSSNPTDGNPEFQMFQFGELQVRARLDESGNPQIIASDVCKALGLSGTNKALKGLPDDEKGTTKVRTPGGIQDVLYVTEAGLYRLIFRSNKRGAETFRKWVFSEVLPALRKHGSYSLAPRTPLEALKQIVASLEWQERQIIELHEQQAQQAIDIEEINARLNDADFYTVLQWCKKQRLQHTIALRQMWGKAATELSAARNIEIKEVIEGPYPVGRYHKDVLRAVCVPRSKTHGQLPLPE